MQKKELDLYYVGVCQDAKATTETEITHKKHKGFITTEILGTIGSIALAFIFAIIIIIKVVNANPRYAIPGEDGNGNHFIYVTEVPCEVYEVTNNLVTVEYQGNSYFYKGNLYAFKAYNTELEVGDKIICRFTDDMKIHDVLDIY